ncbi:MAG: NAD(P)/FAD-dependent oxidoreductase [Egibacteraceae bacterium]
MAIDHLGEHEKKVVIMGAGPAGLTAAWELTGKRVPCEILEADPVEVGGIARTASYRGFRFDIGGHRFFTKSDEVRRVWREILDPEDWLQVPRMSRIYYKGKFFAYPLKAFDALGKLGVVTSARCVLSYLMARALPRTQERSFEDWIVNRFGERLYRIFFQTYTEKVWGMPCSEISADWAAQRIKGLSLKSAIRNALSPQRGGDKGVIKTLIDRFDYPKHGPGMMWERAAEIVQKRDGVLHMGAPVVRLHHGDGRLRGVVARNGTGEFTATGTDYISTLPIRSLVRMLNPPAPEHVRAAAEALRYRDFLTVVLVLDRAEVFPDNWIYIHDPAVALGRVQNFKNWSPLMVPDPAQTALGLEYFCTEGDRLWEAGDADLLALGARELEQIGLCRAGEVIDGTVVRMPKAYPVYDDRYKEHVALIRGWLREHLANLQLVGRNGMHKYNNQDHSMMAALLAARNILGERWDPWKVNTDAEYHEEVRLDEDATGRLIPRRMPVP